MRTRQTIFLIFLNISGALCCSMPNKDLISAYFRFKGLDSGTIFHCCPIAKVLPAFKFISASYKVNLLEIDGNYSEETVNKTFIRNYKHIAVIVDASCPNLNELFIKYAEIRAMYDPYHWLLISSVVLDYESLFRGVNINVNADVNAAILDDDGNYKIIDIYNQAARHDGELKFAQVGNYFAENVSYVVPYLDNKYWVRKNMTGTKFKSAVVIPDPINISVSEYIDDDTNRDINSQNRFQANAIRHCQHMYNFSVDVRATNSWGYKIKGTTNGSFDGLVGLLQRREVDFGSTPLINKYDRIPVVDYSYGNWILKSAFIYRPPKGSASSIDIFLRPFTLPVWLCTAALATSAVIGLKLVVGFEWKVLQKFGVRFETAWTYLMLYVLAAFCFQGMEYQPTLASSRVFVLFLFVFSILFYQFYSGYLVSYLLMDPPRQINNLRDLLLSSLDAGIEEILIDRDYFIQTTDPAARELFTRKVTARNRSGFYLPEEGLEMVRRGGFAFHVETSTAYPIIVKTFEPSTVCELEEVQMYHTQPMHTNLQKRSPFKEMLNYCMLRLVENGQMFRLRRHWDAHKPECIDADHTLEITVGLAEFSCALMVLAAGVVLSMICFLSELHWSRKHLK